MQVLPIRRESCFTTGLNRTILLDKWETMVKYGHSERVNKLDSVNS